MRTHSVVAACLGTMALWTAAAMGDLCPQARFTGPGAGDGMAWDGEYLWVSWAGGTEEVFKLTKSGAVVFSFGTPDYQPWGITYASGYLWICDPTTDKVYQVTTTGTVVNSFRTPEGEPRGLTFDGQYLWLSNISYGGSPQRLYKMTLAGAVVDSFATGRDCYELAWDGSTIWASEVWNAGSNPHNLLRYSTSGVLLSVHPLSWTCPTGLTFDGSSLWNMDFGNCTGMVYEIGCIDAWTATATFTATPTHTPTSSSTATPTMTMTPTSTGTPIPSGLCPQVRFKGPGAGDGMAWDGENLWVSWAGGTEEVFELNKSGSVLSSFATPGYQPWGITYGAGYLWICDPTTDKVRQVTTTGTVVGMFDTPAGEPRGLTFDGQYLWLSNISYGGSPQRLYKMTLAGVEVDSFATGRDCYELAWDGSTIWASEVWNAGSNPHNLLRYSTSGALLDVQEVSWTCPTGLTFDGSSLWNMDFGNCTGMVYEIGCVGASTATPTSTATAIPTSTSTQSPSPTGTGTATATSTGVPTATPSLWACHPEYGGLPENRRFCGNAVSIHAKPPAGCNYVSVRFQYRALPGGTWLPIKDGHTDADGFDYHAPFFAKWNVDALATGQYEVRMTATHPLDGEDPNPVLITVEVVWDCSQAGVHGATDLNGDDYQVVEAKASCANEAMVGNSARGIVKSAVIPAGGLIEDTKIHVTDANVNLHSGMLNGFLPAEMVEVFLESGQTTLLAGMLADLDIGYQDDDSDGIVDGTAINEDDLALYSWNVGAGAWQMESATIDAEENVVHGKTNHFSLFAVMAVVPGTATPVPTPMLSGIHRDKHVDGEVPHVSGWVELTWISQQGLTYEVYQSPSMETPAWTVAGTVTASNATTTFVDAGPVYTERYYRIGVQGTNPLVYSPNECGVLPVCVMGKSASETSQPAMLGISLQSTTPPQTIQQVVGWQGVGADDPAAATEIWAYRTSEAQYQSAWLYDAGGTQPSLDGLWLDPNSGGPSSLAMPAGAGFWLFNKEDTAQSLCTEGLVMGQAPAVTFMVDGTLVKAHLIGQSLAADVPLDEMHTTLTADGAKGSTDPAMADEIWVYDQARDVYAFAWLFNSAGSAPSLDGQWMDPNLGLPTALVLKRGMGWWYFTKPDPARTPGWTWTEPRPY